MEDAKHRKDESISFRFQISEKQKTLFQTALSGKSCFIIFTESFQTIPSLIALRIKRPPFLIPEWRSSHYHYRYRYIFPLLHFGSLFHLNCRAGVPYSPGCSSAHSTAASAATVPSAAAVVSWRTAFARQSPAVKTPGTDVRQSSPAVI